MINRARPVFMRPPMELLAEFHQRAKVRPTRKGDLGYFEQLQLRRKLITEEFLETMSELDNHLWGYADTEALAKELADLLVVVYGTAEVMGIPLDDVFEEVMESNMSKTEECTWREDGKLLKGPNYQPPDMEYALRNMQ